MPWPGARQTGALSRAHLQDYFQRLVSDLMDHGFYHLAALWAKWTMGSTIWPLAWQNCSSMPALSRAARVTMWYGFFTAAGSLRIPVW